MRRGRHMAALTLALLGACYGRAEGRLRDVPEGVSIQRLGEHRVFLVRDHARLTAFLPDVRHLPGERELWWCPREQVFASPTHGELFDPDGRRLGGPAVGDLNRIQVLATGGRVHASRFVEGARASRGGGASPPEDVPWDKGPGSFCRGALRLRG